MKKFLVQTDRNRIAVALVDVSGETDKTIAASEIQSIFGSVYCSSRMSKDGNLLFDTLEEAAKEIAKFYYAKAQRAEDEMNSYLRIASGAHKAFAIGDLKELEKERYK